MPRMAPCIRRWRVRARVLDEIWPETAVISVGKRNRYGHPAQETLERLALAGTDIYRTDLQGTVTVRSGKH